MADKSIPAYDEFIDFITSLPALADIVDYSLSPTVQARFSELTEFNRQLNDSEAAELSEYQRLDHMIQRAKLSASKRLQNIKIASYRQADILFQLDNLMSYVFPGLYNLYTDTVDVRLSAYRDETRWAFIIEFLGVTDHDWCPHGGIHNWLYYFGNCVLGNIGTENEDCICMTDDGPEGPTFDEEYRLQMRPEAKTLRIRGTIIPIDISPAALATKEIIPDMNGHMSASDLLRILDSDYRDLLLATEEELRRRIPPDLPLILRLNEWYHPDEIASSRFDSRFGPDQLPGFTRTFQMIANVLVTGDPSLYQPVEEPNTPTWNISSKRKVEQF